MKSTLQPATPARSQAAHLTALSKAAGGACRRRGCFARAAREKSDRVARFWRLSERGSDLEPHAPHILGNASRPLSSSSAHYQKPAVPARAEETVFTLLSRPRHSHNPSLPPQRNIVSSSTQLALVSGSLPSAIATTKDRPPSPPGSPNKHFHAHEPLTGCYQRSNTLKSAARAQYNLLIRLKPQ